MIGVYIQADIYIYISSQSDAISLRLKAKYKNVANFLIMFLFSHDSKFVKYKHFAQITQYKTKCTSFSTEILQRGRNYCISVYMYLVSKAIYSYATNPTSKLDK